MARKSEVGCGEERKHSGFFFGRVSRASRRDRQVGQRDGKGGGDRGEQGEREMTKMRARTKQSLHIPTTATSCH
jgi:hypothetical protein